MGTWLVVDELNGDVVGSVLVASVRETGVGMSVGMRWTKDSEDG